MAAFLPKSLCNIIFCLMIQQLMPKLHLLTTKAAKVALFFQQQKKTNRRIVHGEVKTQRYWRGLVFDKPIA